MFSSSRYYTVLIAILAIALVSRLVAASWWEQRLPSGQKFGFADSESYWGLAQKLARGEPYEFSERKDKIFRTPGYPLILAGMFRFLGNDDPPVYFARVLGALLGTASVAAVAALGGVLFGSRGGLLAASIAAVHPEAIAPSVFVLSEAPFCPLMMFQLVAWTLAWKSDCRRRCVALSFAGGLLAGLATLMRPSWLLFLPFALAIGLLLGPQRPKQLVVGVAMLSGLCLAMLPWWFRNYEVAGRFVPTSLQVGASLYDGLNPKADGGSNMTFVDPGIAAFRQREQALPAQAEGTFEDRVDGHFRDASIAWARQNPGRVVQLMAIKFGRMWNAWPNASEFKSRKLSIVLAAGYLPLMLAAAYGLFLTARRDWPYLLCALQAVYFTLLHMVFVSSIRYRQPALLPLMVLAAGAVLHVYDRSFRRMDSVPSPT
jgi:4-amino-4-deoxy-L-arabinose transferase-like glycosyltransferase